jgi:hypothetical protein
MHLKVFVKLKKTIETLSSGQNTQKNPKNPKEPKNPKKNKKKQKKPKKTPWAGFFKKTRVFSNPDFRQVGNQASNASANPTKTQNGLDPHLDPLNYAT